MYRDKGLVIVGVHTPEFAFESVPSNVRAAIKRLGIRYPVALDPKYGTWNHWGNQYWPAEYLIDKQGHVRHAHFGEGDYAGSEKNIRTLLGEKPASPASDRLADITPTGPISPETYLGYSRIDRYTGKKLITDKEATYAFPSALGQNDLAYGGRWKVEAERIVAGQGARLRFHYYARKVYIVLGGKGRVQALVDGKPVTSFPVTSDKLYTVVDKNAIDDATLELRFTPGRRGVLLHVRLVARAGRAVSAVLLALPEEARQLGGEGVAGGDVRLVQLVDPPLELLDVRSSLLVRGDRLAHLADVRVGRLVELLGVDLGAEQLGEPHAQRARRLRRGRERDVMRHRSPEARRGDVRLPARVVDDADDAGRPLVARGLEPELLDK